MKHHFIYILSIICLLSLHSCNRFDNFDEPASMLSGKVTYNNEYIGVRGSGKKIQMQLYQEGFGKKTLFQYMLLKMDHSRHYCSMVIIN